MRDIEDVHSQLKRLQAINGKTQSIKLNAETKRWMKQRLSILEQLRDELESRSAKAIEQIAVRKRGDEL